MLQPNQCFAPSKNGRCTNKSLKNSSHCELHGPKATKLRHKYKKLCDLVKNIDLNKKFDDISSKISYITACYDLYDKAFEARLNHREYAIAPDLYDQGHDYQFIDLNNKINKCEEILNNLYESYEYQDERDDESDDESNYSDDDNSIVLYEKRQMTISQKIRLNKQYRASKEREINEYIEKYITENKIIIERKRLLIYNLCTCISLIFGESELIDRPKIIAMISLIIKLVNINYFENFVPRTCQHPECACTLPYNLSLGEDYFQEEKCFCKYMEAFSEESLKFLFEIFLFNKRKILPFVNDIENLYEEHDYHIIYIDAELIWKNNRLNLRERENVSNRNVQFKKPSEAFAVSRLKDKYYEQKLLNDFFS